MGCSLVWNSLYGLLLSVSLSGSYRLHRLHGHYILSLIHISSFSGIEPEGQDLKAPVPLLSKPRTPPVPLSHNLFLLPILIPWHHGAVNLNHAPVADDRNEDRHNFEAQADQKLSLIHI